VPTREGGVRVFRILLGDSAGCQSLQRGAEREEKMGCCVLCAGPFFPKSSLPGSWAPLAMSIRFRGFVGVGHVVC
jgi:hypothetical protein